MNVTIYIEGGGESPDLQTECRKGFRLLLSSLGFSRSAKLVACGTRNNTLEKFKTALKASPSSTFIALLVDSEDPVDDIENPWEHLEKRDGSDWKRPENVTDEQALLMVTCMETWIIADRDTLRKHYKELQESALPPTHKPETLHRKAVYEKLAKATQRCSNAYRKGARSFEILGKLSPAALRELPSFARVERILRSKLG